MVPSIYTGDFILVNKYIYGSFERRFFSLPFLVNRPPQKNDVVVFNVFNPDSLKKKYLIKRIYASSGDKLSLLNDLVIINDQIDSNSIPAKVFFNYPYFNENWKILLSQGFRLPKKGEYVVIDKNNIFLYENIIKSEGNLIEIIEGNIYINKVSTKLYEINNDCFFMIGDNIEKSFDSRYFGLIPEKDILGKAEIVYFSCRGEGNSNDVLSYFSSINYHRIGKTIK